MKNQTTFYRSFQSDVCSFKLISKQLLLLFFILHSLTQLMLFKQSFITIRPRTMSQSNRPVPYTEKVPSYKGENQNIRDVNKVFRIRGPHSSNSDPLNFLKKKRNNIQKTTSVSSEEQKLKQEIEQLKVQEKQLKAQWVEYKEKLKYYEKLSEEALQRGDDKIINYYQLRMKQCMDLISENGKRTDQIKADRRELKKQLQKLQAKII